MIPRGALESIRTSMGGVENFATEVVGKIVVFGTLAGDEVTSQEFQFPVTICTDCIVVNAGPCPLPADTTVRSGNSCNVFQDGVVDCCATADGLFCPAYVAEN
jgi:hypothetical protein